MKIYLDNCCYNRPYDDQSQVRIQLETQAKLFDYTVWQREYFDRLEPGQFAVEALEYAKGHPHKGKGQRV